MIKNNFLWHGVVEDIHDPLKLGRVRVRIYGVHDPRTSFADGSIGLSTSDLPWAHVLTQGAAMNGIGLSPSFLVQGTWVTGYFRDSFKQEPIITGALNGFAQETNSKYTNTFCDPDKVYPLNDHLNEQDVNRLARNDFDDTFSVMLDASSPLTSNNNSKHEKKARHQILIDKAANRTLNVQQVSSSLPWDEPYQSYSATYPHNLVMETTGGLIREYDSTPGYERIHEYHNTGTFYEIRPDGSKITKVVGDDYEITIKDKNVSIAGNLNITVNQSASILVNGTAHVTVDQAAQVDCKSLLANVQDTATVYSTDTTVTAGNTAVVNATDIAVNASNNMSLLAVNNLSLQAQTLTCTGSTLAVFTGGTVSVG